MMPRTRLKPRALKSVKASTAATLIAGKKAREKEGWLGDDARERTNAFEEAAVQKASGSKMKLTPEQIVSVLTPKWNEYIPHIPTPKQRVFLCLDSELDVFYGGAVGGGKSDALLMAALQYVDVPGYVALIVRATYKDLSLPGAIMDRAKEWLMDTDAKWAEADKTWTFPSGAKLVFGHLDGPNDHYAYQSANFHFVGIDEMAQLRWVQVLYLFSRTRREKGCKIPIRFRGASNPGGLSHAAIKERYIDPRTRPGVFIPAGLADNPYLDRVEYLKSLDQLDIVTRKQLKDGDWDIAIEGNTFKRDWFEVVDDYPHTSKLKRIRWWDLAATKLKPGKAQDPDWTAGALLGLLDGIIWVINVVRTRSTPGEVENLITLTAKMDGPKVDIWMEQEPGASGKIVIDHYARHVLLGYTFHGENSTGSKEEYAKPFSSAAEAGNVKIVNGIWVSDFLDELVMFPNSTIHDDQVDSASKAFCKLTRSRKKAGSWGAPRPHWANRRP